MDESPPGLGWRQPDGRKKRKLKLQGSHVKRKKRKRNRGRGQSPWFSKVHWIISHPRIPCFWTHLLTLSLPPMYGTLYIGSSKGLYTQCAKKNKPTISCQVEAISGCTATQSINPCSSPCFQCSQGRETSEYAGLLYLVRTWKFQWKADTMHIRRLADQKKKIIYGQL